MEQVEKIIEKFRYNEKLANKLRNIVPGIVEYYGKENEELIINTLLNDEIYITNSNENIYDLIKKLDKSDINFVEDGMTVSDSDLKRASGVSSSIPYISIDENGNAMLDKVNRFIAFRGLYDLNEEVIISDSTLIHEICHSIKSYNNECTLEDNVLTMRSGLIQTKYNVKNIYDKVYCELVEDKNVGIEEGVNEYDTRNICDILKIQNSLGGYAFESQVAKGIMEDLQLKDKILAAQFYPETINIEEEYNKVFKDNSNHFSAMNSKFDQVVKKGYDMFANMLNLEEWKKNNFLELQTLQNDLVTDLLEYKIIAVPKKEKLNTEKVCEEK